MDRRSFFKRLGQVTSVAAIAPVVAPPKPELHAPDVMVWPHDVYAAIGATVFETPDGENITDLKTIGERLYVFTDKGIYVVPEQP